MTSMDLARAVASLLIRSDLYERLDGLCIACGGDGAVGGEAPFEPARGQGPRPTGGWVDGSRRLGT